jgi:hypothetical protein
MTLLTPSAVSHPFLAHSRSNASLMARKCRGSKGRAAHSAASAADSDSTYRHFDTSMCEPGAEVMEVADDSSSSSADREANGDIQ